MSRTLFRYIFSDLLRIFFLTAGALSGIMSFGGLLRPLMQQGLDAGQVMQLLTYLSPAMMAYAFPIAALFATTVVYGRLSADNEIVACRAGGISHLSLAMPAIVLGLVTALVTLGFLCFVVPVFTLKVERVIYSNVAQIVAGELTRKHSVQVGDHTVFAREARVMSDADNPGEQRIVLVAPTIMVYDRQNPKVKVPAEFFMAEKATAIIRRQQTGSAVGGEEAELTITLDNGIMFRRDPGQTVQGGIGETQFGPQPLKSFIDEETKFMALDDLKRLYEQPWRSAAISERMNEFVRMDQSREHLNLLIADLQNAAVVFDAQGERYVLEARGAAITMRDDGIWLEAVGEQRPVLRQERDGHTNLTADASSMRISSTALGEAKRMIVSIDMEQAATMTNERVEHKNFNRVFSVAMPVQVSELESRRTEPQRYAAAEPGFMRKLVTLSNSIQSELHARAAFAISCLVLVMVGCALGMMFKSGNFLTAFAISFVPALLCITLIVAGQQTAGNVPRQFTEASNPLATGLRLIWSGNAAVFGIGAALLWRLQRQ